MPCRLVFIRANKKLLRPQHHNHASYALLPRGGRAGDDAGGLRISSNSISPDVRGLRNYSTTIQGAHYYYTTIPTTTASTTPLSLLKCNNYRFVFLSQNVDKNGTTLWKRGQRRRCLSTVSTTGGTTDHLLLANRSPPIPRGTKQQQQQQSNEEVESTQSSSSSSTSSSSASTCLTCEQQQQQQQQLQLHHTMESASQNAEIVASAAAHAERILANMTTRIPTTAISNGGIAPQTLFDAAEALLLSVSQLQKYPEENAGTTSRSTMMGINNTHWYSLHRAIVCITSRCLDWIEISQRQQHQRQASPLLVPSSTTTAASATASSSSTTTTTTKRLLDCALKIARRARDLDLPLHLPLYQRLADALTRQHVAFVKNNNNSNNNNNDSRHHYLSAMHDMDNTITNLLLEVASHANVWEILLQSSSSCSSSFFNTPLLILVEHGPWKDANELLTAVARRIRRQVGSGRVILDEKVAMQLVLLLRQGFRQHRQTPSSASLIKDTREEKHGMIATKRRPSPSSERNAMTLVALLEPTLLRMIEEQELEDDDNEDEEQLSLSQLLYQQDYFHSYPRPMRQFLQNRWFQSLHREQAAAILSNIMLEQQHNQQAATSHDHEDNVSNDYYEEADDISASDNRGNNDNEVNDDDEEELADALFFLLGQHGADGDIFDKHMDPLDLKIERILTKRIKDDRVKCLVSDLLRHAELPSAHDDNKNTIPPHLEKDNGTDDHEDDDDNHTSSNDGKSLLPTRKSHKGRKRAIRRRRSNRTRTQEQQQQPTRKDDFDVDDKDSSDSDDDDDDSSDSDSDDDDDDDLFRQRNLSGYDLPDIIAQVRVWNGGYGVVLTEEYKDTLYSDLLRNAQREMDAKFSSLPPSPTTVPRK